MIDKYIILGTYWEYAECLLIDKSADKTDTLWNEPYLSPSSEFIAAQSLPYGLEGLQNGLQIWKVKNGYLTKFIEIDQQERIPKELAWEKKNTLVFSYVKVNDFWDKQEKAKKYYARLSIKN
ncbi:MAG: hypothetical protein GH151_11260 [Bacteroidetes bacterium]|nr:hypothetical protein [Bacteroidota bacterium]